MPTPSTAPTAMAPAMSDNAKSSEKNSAARMFARYWSWIAAKTRLRAAPRTP